MKVYTQTWYRGNNYGSVLQAYALPQAIQKMGYQCEVLAYAPNRLHKWKLKLINRSIKETINYKINELLMKCSTRSVEQAFHNLSLFDEFRKNYMQITAHCTNKKEILNVCGEDATFVCGSDQIWNPYFYDPYYFLSFVNDETRKIAYAPSFGVEEIPKYSRKGVKKQINRFNKISVREKRGAELVKELTGKEATVVVDPTLLLSNEEWSGISAPLEEKEPYLMCYFLSNNPVYHRVAQELANQLGLKIRLLPMVAADFKREETIQEPIGPREWLSLVRNAEFVLTDSFHCGLFSIRFHKNFYIFQRFSSEDKRGQNSRVQSLLKSTKLEDRMLIPGQKHTYTTISEECFDKADNELKTKIEFSKKWLEAALQPR